VDADSDNIPVFVDETLGDADNVKCPLVEIVNAGVVECDGIFDMLAEDEGVCAIVAKALFDTDDDTEDVDDCDTAADTDSVANPVFVDETLGDADNVKCPLVDDVCVGVFDTVYDGLSVEDNVDVREFVVEPVCDTDTVDVRELVPLAELQTDTLFVFVAVLLTDTELDTLLLFDTDTVLNDDTLGLIEIEAEPLDEPAGVFVCSSDLVPQGDGELLGDILAEDDTEGDGESEYDIVFSLDAV
jgi:hypothetical protein